LSKIQKYLIGVAAFVVVFFGFVIVRIGVAQPSDSIKLAKIPKESQLNMKAYENAYPLEYKSFMRNNEMAPSPTGYGGSQEFQRLDQEPEMLENFKGYKFSLDYADDRGHTYAGIDLMKSKRFPGQPGACITCKTPYVGKFYEESGWQYASKPVAEMTAQIPEDGWFSCATCHEPDTMALRVYQPAFIEAMQRRGIDVKQASNQDMRSYVCGQCHVEYYFDTKDKHVVLPWDKGLTAEDMYAYYSEKPGGFEQDWVHPDSKTKVLKAQHPDYETWSKGAHADAGVTCVDCHMPFMRDNGQKYTSHFMSSPLKTIEDSCLKCHDQDKDTLIQRVKTIHDNTFKLQRIAGNTVAKAHLTVKAAIDAGATDEQLTAAHEYLRQAQWYWDFCAAENGVGFHNPDQIMRTLGLSIDCAHQAIEAANAAVKGNI